MGQCLVCHNKTEKRLIAYIQEYQGKWVAVKDVPADICPICGEQYFDPDTAGRIQNTIYSQEAEITLDIPLYEFEKTSATGGLTGYA